MCRGWRDIDTTAPAIPAPASAAPLWGPVVLTVGPILPLWYPPWVTLFLSHGERSLVKAMLAGGTVLVASGRDLALAWLGFWGVGEGWIDRRAANYALEQLSFGIATSSTRSAMALMGYLGWRQAYVGHRTIGGAISGLISAKSVRS